VSLQQQLEKHIADWATAAGFASLGTSWVKACQDERFGHFQSNIAMVAGKSLKKNPRELAVSLVQTLAACDDIEPPEIAGPGFVNIRFRSASIARALQGLARDPRLGIPAADKPRTILVDFSSPNVAKEMHVGHIRSTVLGDTIARIYSSLNHHVIRDNHLGDWGTQFGKLILGYKMAGRPELTVENALAEMERLYQDTHQASTRDPALLEQARQELLKLQQGDPENTALWNRFRELSQQSFERIYQRLGTHFDHTLAESFYNPWLDGVVEELLARGIARLSEGASVIFFDDNEELKEHPFLIRKSDGASLYATTDLATLRYRTEHFHTDSVIYVTDGRQQLHFKQLFASASLWGVSCQLEHVWFGAILGKDGKPLKTRDGNPIKLRDLLDEAEVRAAKILREKRPDLSDEKMALMAPVIGIGALKYADQAQNRNLDYVFDWDRLLAFDGNTAPYLLNAYVRTRSILRKADQTVREDAFVLEHALEQDLARKLLAFGPVVELAAQEYRPHHICSYLYECAALYHRFFENCPVLKAENQTLKNSRLGLCRLTGDVLRKGLELLGIGTLEEM